jgi:two-component system, chemotaxis family, CheB/CheR fusion protein
MDNDFQHRVMQTFHYALRPGGYLFIGPSESISRESRLFSAADKKHRILQRHDSVRATLPEFLPQGGTAATVHSASARIEDQIDKSARRAMAKHSPPISSSTAITISSGFPAARLAAIWSLRKAMRA